MAEKEGFEPSIPLWGIHDFQSCALGQLRDFSSWFGVVRNDLFIIQHKWQIVKPFFRKLKNKINPSPVPDGTGESCHILARWALFSRMRSVKPRGWLRRWNCSVNLEVTPIKMR